MLVVGSGGCSDVEFNEELFDVGADIVADVSDSVEILSGRVIEGPFDVPFAGIDGACVAAPHEDDDIGGADDVIGPGFGKLSGDIDADFCHCGDSNRVNFASGLGTTGVANDTITADMGQPAEGHLRSPGIVNAEKQYGRAAVGCGTVEFGDRAEAFASKFLGKVSKELRDRCVSGESVIGLGDDLFDHVGRKVIVVVAGDVDHRAGDCGTSFEVEVFVAVHQYCSLVVAKFSKVGRNWSMGSRKKSALGSEFAAENHPMDAHAELELTSEVIRRRIARMLESNAAA